MNKIKRIIVMSMTVISIAFVACSASSYIYSNANGTENKLVIERDTDITLDASSDLKISRKSVKNTPMAKEESWSLFVYMTGSDLESDYQSATNDIKEMFEAKCVNDNVNIIIQTGGSGKWHTDDIEAGTLGRYKVVGDKLKKNRNCRISIYG